MSKLPNAPLLEVVFELRWPVVTEKDFNKFNYLYGDLYSAFKEKYPVREPLPLSQTPEIPRNFLINNPLHRYRSKDNYPLIQVGPGLLTLNTIDEKYFWEDYSKDSKELIESFFNIYEKNPTDKFTPSLLYYDFFVLDMENVNVLEFVNNSLNLNINQGFLKTNENPKNFVLNLSYPVKLGDLIISFNIGKNNKNEDGLVLQTRLNGTKFDPNPNDIVNWLDEAHDFCSNSFKELTKGSLYESFK